MTGPEQIVRHSVFQALNGNLTLTVDSSASPVKLFSGPVDDENVYVIQSNETASDQSSKHHFGTRVSFTLDIVSKQAHNSNKSYVDDISNQADAILLPTPQTNGLVSMNGVQFGRLKRENVTYLDMAISSTQTIMRKLVTYSVTVFE
jgi:hypothetical protein